MKRTIIISLLIQILFNASLIAQESKFGKVTLEELSELEHSLEPDAKAAVLYQKGKAEVRGSMTLKVYRKIKIYKSVSNDWGEIGVLLYEGERITKLKAYTYNEENGEIVKDELEKGEVFTEELTENWRIEKFAMPNVKDGSIIEYQYQVSSPYTFQIPKWEFQYDIPCNKSYYYLETPNYSRYYKKDYGYIPVQGKKSSRAIGYSDGQLVLNTVEYNVDYLPSLKDIPYILDIDDYRLAVEYQREFKWDLVAKVLRGSAHFGRPLNRPLGKYKEFIDSVKTMPIEERIEKVYRKVQSDFTWNKKYGKYTDNGIAKLIKEGNGNVGDINLFLINLLNKAGVKTFPVLTIRRHYGMLDENNPTFGKLDYVFGLIMEGNEHMYVDATDKFLNPGELPERALNVKGVLLQELGADVVAESKNIGVVVDIENPNKRIINSFINASFNEYMDLECSEGTKYMGTAALSRRKALSKNKSEDKLIEYLEQKNSDFSFESIKVSNKEASQKPLKLSSKYTLENKVDVVGDKLYIDPLLGNGIYKNPFVSEERRFPIFFPSTEKETYTISLGIPEGYEVEFLPEPVMISAPNEVASYYFNLQTVGDRIQISSTFSIHHAVLPSQYFAPLKKLYDRAIEVGKQRIVLKKKE